MRRMIVKGSPSTSWLRMGAVAGSHAHPTPTPTLWAICWRNKNATTLKLSTNSVNDVLVLGLTACSIPAHRSTCLH